MLKIDVSNILTRKKAIEPPIVEVQKGVDVSSDDDDYDNNELNFNGASTKRKRAKIAWIFLKQLESEFVVDYEIKPNYSRYRSYDAYGGTKVYYKCKFKSCSVQVYLFYCKNPLKISLFSNHREHQHINDKGKKRGITDEVKKMIQEFYDLGTTGALNIIYALRDKKVEQSLIPTQRQIYNFIDEYKKVLFGSVSMTFLELKNWSEKNQSGLYIGDDEPFVLDFYVSIKDKYFRLVMSTNRLIQLATKRHLLVSDTTYKVIFQGFPLMICGTVDHARHFHPVAVAICTKEKEKDFEFLYASIKKFVPNFSPKYILADAADAISNGLVNVIGKNFTRLMCWSHTQRAIERKLKSEEFEEQITTDIYKLQLSFSQSKFDIGYGLFKIKWKNKIDDMFFDYIEKEWINSNNYGWYEGCAPGYPSTNNALEATNRAIKDVHTFRDRVPLSQFLERLKIILKRWSVDQISFRKYVEEPPILDEHWCDVIDYTNDKPIVNYVDDEGFYLMSRLKGVDFEKFLECLECDKGCLADCDSFKDMTFDTFFELNNSIRIVRTNPDNWKFSKCTCYDYFKTWMCKHILVIAIANNQIFIPEKYFDSEIGSKPKPGKKKKAKHWHERD